MDAPWSKMVTHEISARLRNLGVIWGHFTEKMVIQLGVCGGHFHCVESSNSSIRRNSSKLSVLPKFRFLVVLRGSGGPGAITNRRGMKKTCSGSYVREFGFDL